MRVVCFFRFFITEFEGCIGSFEVLCANIGILTLSSFAITSAHISGGKLGHFLAIGLGLIFVANQIDETFSEGSVDAVDEKGSMVVTLYVHLSHLLLCTVGFSVYFTVQSHSGHHGGTDFLSVY